MTRTHASKSNLFAKTKSEATQTLTEPADPSARCLQNKVGVLMEMCMKQQANLDILFGNEEGIPSLPPRRQQNPLTHHRQR